MTYKFDLRISLTKSGMFYVLLTEGTACFLIRRDSPGWSCRGAANWTVKPCESLNNGMFRIIKKFNVREREK